MLRCHLTQQLETRHCKWVSVVSHLAAITGGEPYIVAASPCIASANALLAGCQAAVHVLYSHCHLLHPEQGGLLYVLAVCSFLQQCIQVAPLSACFQNIHCLHNSCSCLCSSLKSLQTGQGSVETGSLSAGNAAARAKLQHGCLGQHTTTAASWNMVVGLLQVSAAAAILQEDKVGSSLAWGGLSSEQLWVQYTACISWHGSIGISNC